MVTNPDALQMLETREATTYGEAPALVCPFSGCFWSDHTWTAMNTEQ